MKKILLYLGAIVFIANKHLFGSLEDVVNEIYTVLQSIEEKKIKRILNNPSFVSKAEPFLRQLRGFYQHDDFPQAQLELLPRLPDLKDKKIINLTGTSFKEIIAILIEILQSKLDRKSVDTSYSIKMPQHGLRNSFNEKTCDPMYTKIKLGDKYFNFASTYAGGKQVGNNQIRPTSHSNYTETNKECTSGTRWKDYNKMLSEEKKILLANEIARRKVIDSSANKKDEHYSLPIWASIAIAEKLIQTKKITPEGYYYSNDTKPYLFYGDTAGRVEVIKKLILTYLYKTYVYTFEPNTSFIDAKSYFSRTIDSFKDIGSFIFEDTLDDNENYQNELAEIPSDDEDLNANINRLYCEQFSKWYSKKKVLNIIQKDIIGLMDQLFANIQ